MRVVPGSREGMEFARHTTDGEEHGRGHHAVAEFQCTVLDRRRRVVMSLGTMSGPLVVRIALRVTCLFVSTIVASKQNNRYAEVSRQGTKGVAALPTWPLLGAGGTTRTTHERCAGRPPARERHEPADVAVEAPNRLPLCRPRPSEVHTQNGKLCGSGRVTVGPDCGHGNCLSSWSVSLAPELAYRTLGPALCQSTMPCLGRPLAGAARSLPTGEEASSHPPRTLIGEPPASAATRPTGGVWPRIGAR